MHSALQVLAEFAANLDFDHLPPAVVERAQMVLLDTVGAVLAGSRALEVRRLAEHARCVSPSNQATLIGFAGGAEVRWAALVNATGGTSTELDEGHAFARGHPAIHVLPLALALGEARGLSGREVLTAIVAGYEVAARVGMATDLKSAVHPHGTWGTLGAAVAAARLRGQSPEELLEAIRIASSLVLATSFQTAYEGALVRNAYAGVSNQNGLLAADLAACGLTGERDGPATVFGTVLGDSFRPHALVEELGTRFEITRGYFKIHSCCRYNHGALDALQSLQKQHGFTWPEVVRVHVDTYGLAARLNDPHPGTTLAARFSIPYAVGIALVRGSTGPAAFDESALKDPSIRALAEQVHVTEDPELTALTPRQRPARVTVELRDARVVSDTVYSSRGDPERPFSHEELVQKYRDLAIPVIGVEKAGLAMSAVSRFAQLQCISGLTDHLRPEGD
jgi:2-methylcitrate dehydratase PrpD